MPPARARLPKEQIDKGKPAARPGRKAMGLAASESARPPKLQPFHLQKWRLR